MLDKQTDYTPVAKGRLKQIRRQAKNWAQDDGACDVRSLHSRLPKWTDRDHDAAFFWTEAPGGSIENCRQIFAKARDHHSTRFREINQAMIGHDGRAVPEWWTMACYQRAYHRFAKRKCGNYLRALEWWKDKARELDPAYQEIDPSDLTPGAREVLRTMVNYADNCASLPTSPGGLILNMPDTSLKAPLQTCREAFDQRDFPAPWRNARTDREKAEEWVRCARAIFE